MAHGDITERIKQATSGAQCSQPSQGTASLGALINVICS